MPQMMPMLWSLMFIFIILITLMTISFFFFLNIPYISPPKKTKSYFFNWPWVW